MSTHPLILTLDPHGVPHRWVTWQHACFYYAKDLVAWTEGSFVIRGEGTIGGRPHVQSLEYGEEGCRIKVGNTESRKLGDLLGHFLLVSFNPEDLDILRGGPQERRRFLDILLCQHDTTGMELLRRYRQALRQRNAALRLNLQIGRAHV